MKREIKNNFTKYSGLSNDSLIFLIKSTAKINNQKKAEVWKELFCRYFFEGKLFNLYDIFLKISKSEKYFYFIKALEYELKEEETSIPLEHLESFMRNTIDVIEFIDDKVIEKEGLKFEWQFDGLIGLRDILNKIKDAKIHDNNLRQKINLFIDKINETQKTTTVEKEEILELDAPILTEVKNELIAVETNTSLVKQELKHLSIPLSKTNKSTFLNMLENLDIYYPKDRTKIVLRGIKYYPYETARIIPFDCFKELFNEPLENQSITGFLIKAICGVNDGGLTIRKPLTQAQIDSFVPNGDIKDFLSYIGDWLWSVQGMTKEYWDFIMLPLYKTKDKEKDKEKYKEILIDLFEIHFDVIKKYEGKSLSKLLDTKISVNKYLSMIKYNCCPDIKFDKNKSWVLEEETENITVFDYYYMLYDMVSNDLFEYTGNYLIKENLEFYVDSKYITKIVEFINLPLTINITKDVLESVKNTSNSFSKKDNIYSFLKHKFCRNKLTKEEIKFLYKEGYLFLNRYTSTIGAQGDFSTTSEYILSHLTEALDYFDFSNNEDFSLFFSYPIIGHELYGAKNVQTIETLSTITIGDAIINKLKNDLPNEYLIILDYFNGEDSEFKEFVIYDEFKYASSIEKLILQSEKIKIGEEKTFKGYSESDNYGNTRYYTTDNYFKKYIVDYFKSLVTTNKYK